MNFDLSKTWNEFKEPRALNFLFLLLIGDGAFILLSFILWNPSIDLPLLSLEKDRGYPEFYQYVKELSIVVLLISILIKTRSFGFSVWALIFLYLLADDALSIHENFGRILSEKLKFTPSFGLRAKDYGELMTSVMAGAFFLSPLALFYARAQSMFKEVTRHLLILMLGLAFFGVVVDLVHIAVNVGRRTGLLIGAFEDGGEMVVMSFMAWYVFLLNLRTGKIETE